MRIFGLEISRAKALQPVYQSNSGFWGVITEAFTGAWQRGIVTPDSRENIIAFSAVYACVTLRADDVSKLPICLTNEVGDIEVEIENSPYLPVLQKPNRYQTRIQFINEWMTSKLLYGNTYVYKERDARGIVTAMYVLDPRYTTPLVSDAGDVYYQLRSSKLAGIAENQTLVVDASEIIHDRCATLWHPLVGVSPIYACGASATQGMRIQSNAVKFFENMSRPSGVLTAPGNIPDETAKRLKEEFENNFSHGNLGRLLVGGSGLSYSPMTIPAVDAQLIQQLDWTAKDVARCFKVPLYKIGGEAPAFNSAALLNQDYYAQALQKDIEDIEELLRVGLNLKPGYAVRMDLDCLLRMDPLARAEISQKLVGSAVQTPNEARAERDLPPLDGGDSAYLQQQYYSLSALAKRDSQSPPPPALPAPDNNAPPADAAQRAAAEANRLIEAVRKGLPCLTAN